MLLRAAALALIKQALVGPLSRIVGRGAFVGSPPPAILITDYQTADRDYE